MPAWPEWRSLMKVLSCAGAFCFSTISYLIFGRSKLATKPGAPASPSRSMISFRVSSSAVAVRAIEQIEATRRQQPLRGNVEQIEVSGDEPRLDRGGFAGG